MRRERDNEKEGESGRGRMRRIDEGGRMRRERDNEKEGE